MSQRKTLYDMMAIMIRELLENTDNRFIRNFFTISQKKREEFDGFLSNYFPEFIKEGNPKEISYPYGISEKIIEKIEGFTKSCLEEENFLLLAEFLNKLDSCLALSIRNYTTEYEEIFGLNDNWKEQEIQLLPRCYCSWEHKGKAKNSSYSLNHLLNHFYFIDTKTFHRATGFCVSHIFIRESIFQRALERQALRIGLTPLYDGAELTLIYEEKENCVFQVEAVSDLEIRKVNAVSILEKAKKEEVDILCYPEMLGSPMILKALQERLQKFPEEGEKPYPSLVAAPSCWQNRSNKTILLDEMGEVLCVQGKQHPYSFLNNGQEYEEDIEGDRHICLIHCNGIGRIAIAICKDALIRNYIFHMLDILKVTLLIIPSFSTGFFDFETNLEMCKAFDCNVVWVNTCSAKKISEKKAFSLLGYVLKTGKRSNIKNGLWPFGEEECPKREGKECKDCLYTQDMYMEYRNY